MKSALSVLRRWLDLDRELVRGGVKLFEFAKKWGVDNSTAQRDIRAFRKLGQVVRWIGGRSTGGLGYGGSAPLFYRNVEPVVPVEHLQGEERTTFTDAAGVAALTTPTLRLPEARVLAALMPDDPTSNPHFWPLRTRARLSREMGYKVSGTVTSALNGIREGSSSGKPHPGLLAMGLVEAIVLDIDGVMETDYCITPLGIRAYQEYVATHGVLPQVRDAATCTNERYRKP